jgi:hypothetical protein
MKSMRGPCLTLLAGALLLGSPVSADDKGKGHKKAQQAHKKQVPHQKQFRAADHNRDGVVDWRDRRGAVRPVRYSQARMAPVPARWRDCYGYDTNGFVNLGEWRCSRSSFAWLDTNNDGLVERAEMYR